MKISLKCIHGLMNWNSRSAVCPWIMKVYGKVSRELRGPYGFARQHTPRRIMNKTVWWWQRSKRGWADCDTWNLDGYITRVTADMLDHLAGTTHSYPGQGEWDTPEKWEAHLRDLATRLRVWNDDTFTDDNAYETTRNAMREFSENLGHYWD